jgi:hypothetical protein
MAATRDHRQVTSPSPSRSVIFAILRPAPLLQIRVLELRINHNRYETNDFNAIELS